MCVRACVCGDVGGCLPLDIERVISPPPTPIHNVNNVNSKRTTSIEFSHICCSYLCMHVCMRVCVRVCMYLCVYVHVRLCMQYFNNGNLF